MFRLVHARSRLLHSASYAGLSQRFARQYATANAADVSSRKPLFDKILIANRGEIACRVMKTARKLGIKTVAVYSEADRNSMHVQMADEAYLIGPATSSESYLRMDKIIDVARKSNAQAIHPGYGFLSENAEFAKKVEEASLVFIGPPPQAIIDMGSKSESKIIMTRANVPVVPGYHGENQSAEHLKKEADQIGYPVLIKAIKGGGGKGMRIVEKAEDFDTMLESARREAIKSFGDDQVLVEKYILRPRHIEVQVFADKGGEAVYLFERDCSVQRRHQKVLEEAPAPGLTPELRHSLGTKAVAAAKAVNYVGAGTVEFIFDTDTNEFYFMEMNTRLQVEHPVTEMVTATDLVHWQLDVAAGNPLPLNQEQLRLDGHAFEARIYAENPANNFLPDTGPLIHMKTPVPSDSLRAETGVRQGDQVSVYYDPMISKLVVRGQDRTEALRALRKALDEFEVVGLNTNIDFLKSLASHPAFISGDVDTGFIKKHESALFKPQDPASPVVLTQAALSFVAKALLREQAQRAMTSDPFSPWGTLAGQRLNHTHTKKLTFLEGEKEVVVEFEYLTGNEYNVEVTDSTGAKTTLTNVRLELNDTRETLLVAHIGDRKIQSTVVQNGSEVVVFLDGTKRTFAVPEVEYDDDHHKHDTGGVRTPMPCKISQINVQPGQKVVKGQPLVVLEAMKMEHVIKSPQDGVIKKIHFSVGDLVGEKKSLLSFEDSETRDS
ncbi:carbamoyl-phosphate synthase L chain, ATP binding domain-containing protein [Polychytrium aggregatum]|uniref:carbamoyl-phosphate synthase L chain, ATP binding domain-containing protein n=1 Tax=Polychytrium aggregatum TaxID=110093 RepID=UPI0022FE41D4|nr:carbamoyl-phosphate synthase L chain, ATP binding domain-containing protein [Polychytrium aggregatum]KAI9193561.1 carbamoyl-phosphate synthase L chain, ATP binding domain-containing protein [Polychytrium aggregatum]